MNNQLVNNDINPELCIALTGNPNTGKTTLFNRLTGTRQTIGNYPGVTVERKEGKLTSEALSATIIDLPGTYSLPGKSGEEQIVNKVLSGCPHCKSPDLIICTLDATSLTRNLLLTTQLAQLQIPMILALNFSDELEAQGMELDTDLLSKRLNVKAVLLNASTGEGVPELIDAIVTTLSSEQRMFTIPQSENKPVEPHLRYRWIKEQLTGVIKSGHTDRFCRSDQLDHWITHKLFGLIIFAALMYLVFYSVYFIATPFMGLIDSAIVSLQSTVETFFGDQPALAGLLADGVIGGVGSVVIFLPQIVILFLFISFLESSGYMARSALLMDRILRWCGLSGKSFVPMLSCYACAVPGILATRTIEDRKARLITMLIAPLVSCSARLPVYVLFIGAFIEPVYGANWAAFTLFSFHLAGLILAALVAHILSRFVLKTESQNFLLELPPYRLPKLKDILWSVYIRSMDFLKRAGTIILLMSVLIWGLSTYPGSETKNVNPTEKLENSYLGQAGRFIQPVFAPAGYDWKITIGILSSFPAREVVISTLAVLYGVESEDDTEGLTASLQKAKNEQGQPVFSLAVVVSLLIFYALCMQCAGTVAVIAQESNWGWALFAFSYTSALAWICSVIAYQLLS